MIVQLIVSGILLGGIYVLLSIGLSLILGVSKFVNFAHGDFVMVGTYLAFTCYSALGLVPYAAAPLVIVMSLAFGIVMYVIVKKVIPQTGLSHILITIGLSMILQNVVLMIFKSDVKSVPAVFGDSIKIGNIFLSTEMLISCLFAVLLTVLLLYFVNKTNIGKAMKAVGQDRQAARLMGISVTKVDMITFLLGTTCAVIAGLLLMTIYPTQPTIGTQYNTIAWIIVVLGGLGHLQGAVLSGILIGVSETLSGYYLGSDMKQVVYFVIFVIVIIIRPQGLFSSVGRRVKKR